MIVRCVDTVNVVSSERKGAKVPAKNTQFLFCVLPVFLLSTALKLNVTPDLEIQYLSAENQIVKMKCVLLGHSRFLMVLE